MRGEAARSCTLLGRATVGLGCRCIIQPGRCPTPLITILTLCVTWTFPSFGVVPPLPCTLSCSSSPSRPPLSPGHVGIRFEFLQPQFHIVTRYRPHHTAGIMGTIPHYSDQTMPDKLLIDAYPIASPFGTTAGFHRYSKHGQAFVCQEDLTQTPSTCGTPSSRNGCLGLASGPALQERWNK